MRGALIRKIVFVNHPLGRSPADRRRAGVNEPFEVPAPHRLGNRERSPHIGGANRPAVTERRAGGQMQDVLNPVQMRRIMPVLGKKIAAQYLNVPGKCVAGLKPARREPS